MRKKLLQNLIVMLSAIAMLAALVLVGRVANRALTGLSRKESQQETQRETTLPTVPETLPTAPVTQPVETTIATEPETEPATEETLPPEETTLPTVPETEPPKVTIDAVPQFYQNDYPDDRYDKGTIADSGSGMTALAMVASFMTDHIYTPDVVADVLAEYCGNTFGRVDYGCDLLGLSWRRASNFHDAKAALAEGKVIMAVMNGKSLFGSGYHFIVWTGINDDGLVTVLDPDKDNLQAWNLKEGFQTGFRDGQLIAGYAGGWIFDKSQMPEEPEIVEPEPYADEPRYGDLVLSEEDMTLIAKLICAEGESEPFDGQQAIAEVILNRLASEQFPSTVRNIIYAEGQFEGSQYMYKAEPTYTQYKAIERALYGPYILPEDVVFFAKFAVNDKVWGKIGVHTFCYSYLSE